MANIRSSVVERVPERRVVVLKEITPIGLAPLSRLRQAF